MGVWCPRRRIKAERRNPVLVRLPSLRRLKASFCWERRSGKAALGTPTASTQTPVPPGTTGCPHVHVCVFTRKQTGKKAQGSHRTPGLPVWGSPPPRHPQPLSTWGDPVGNNRWHGSAAQYP